MIELAIIVVGLLVVAVFLRWGWRLGRWVVLVLTRTVRAVWRTLA